MTRALLAAAAASLLAGTTLAAPAISVETLRTVTQTLSSDAYEGRAPTTPGEEKTVAYIADRFAKAGLKPGARGGWFQPVPLVETTVDPKVTMKIAGGATPLEFAYKTDMVLSTRQVTPRIDIAGSDVVFVGYGINAPEKGWNDYAGLDVKGKTVIVLINDPDWKTMSLDGPFGGRAMTYYGRWTYKYEEAARQGAAAVLIVHDTEPAAYPFGVVVSSWSGPQLEIDAKDNHMGESKAIGWITNDAAHRLFAAAGKDYDQLVTAAAQKGFKAVPLGLKASTGFDVKVRRQASRNVVGILPGKTAPGDYVLYTAHWDHLGRCEPVEGDGICNGALDNASGVAGLIAIAEAAAKEGPAARSQVFVAVTAEESGLLGSAYYAENPLYPLKNTVGGVNMDGLNVNGVSRDVTVVGLGKSELDDMVARAAKAQGRTISRESTPEKGSYYRSDHFSFAKLGVPMLDAKAGVDLVEGGPERGKALAADYTAKRYHGPKDEYDPRWDWSGAVQDLELYYAVGHELADGKAWPNWFPKDEFRAIRDKSRMTK
ncbi:M28 family metallopeptidase [Sphingomonas naphthae]|uniref:M28 family metallopeptidase n=1 Tax=Sphingomonas naphthae TaxID=1813468 RepID=A0ABY7TPS5_9SPHN|nr:M28 family metallopeptidase [Sphingomonas naphthae]WCT74991.1 M28 family metallopeptidase [Sphingomonas naphthae]